MELLQAAETGSGCHLNGEIRGVRTSIRDAFRAVLSTPEAAGVRVWPLCDGNESKTGPPQPEGIHVAGRNQTRLSVPYTE